MKIRNPRLLRAASRLSATFAKGLIHSLRFDFVNLGAVTAPMTAIPPGPRYAYAVWHENMLLPIVKFGHPDLAGLVSKHADGQLLAGVLAACGMGVVAGSTSRGGVEAVKGIVSGAAGSRHLVVTPDGPRGPRRVAQGGVVYAASRAGMLLVPVGIGFEAPFRLKSWDRFALPRPGSRAVQINGVPIAIPRDLRTAGLAVYQDRLQAEMDRHALVAEAWARTGRLDAEALLTPLATPGAEGRP